MDLEENVRLASCANSLTRRVHEDGKSFIYIKNSRGPKVEPWGTP